MWKAFQIFHGLCGFSFHNFRYVLRPSPRRHVRATSPAVRRPARPAGRPQPPTDGGAPTSAVTHQLHEIEIRDSR